MAFGLAVSSEELAELTAMICSGIPPEVDCTATWTPEGHTKFTIGVNAPTVKYEQEFIRTDGGLAVDQGVFILPEDSQRRGFAKRLMRNLVLVYDKLGVRQASVIANYDIGGYTWAKLGAQPLDPDLQRQWLLEKLESVADTLQLTAEERAGARGALASAPAHELMHRAASLTGASGAPIGRSLLLGSHWAGFWDLHEPWLRNLLKETLR